MTAAFIGALVLSDCLAHSANPLPPPAPTRPPARVPVTRRAALPSASSCLKYSQGVRGATAPGRSHRGRDAKPRGRLPVLPQRVKSTITAVPGAVGPSKARNSALAPDSAISRATIGVTSTRPDSISDSSDG